MNLFVLLKPLKTIHKQTPAHTPTLLYLSKYRKSHRHHFVVDAGILITSSTASTAPITTPQKSLIETGPASIGPRMAVVSGGSAETETIHDRFPHVELYAANLTCETETIHDLVPHVERYAANLICSMYLQRGLFLYFDTV